MKPILKITAATMLVFALAACSDSDDEPEADEPVVEETETPAPVPALDEAPAEEGMIEIVPADEAPAEEPAAEDAGEAAPADAEPAAVDEAADAGAAAPVGDLAVAGSDLENTLYIELACGRVVIEMFPDVAPQHVERIKTLTREGFYDGVIFHRVIEGFMAQTGDPTGTGAGASEYPDVPAEFSTIPFERGIVGMARGAAPNSANSQFFIMFTRYPSLDNVYTVWGQVTDGMDCVDQIPRGQPPANPETILDMNVAADVQ